jgi:hypothetical protein
MENVPHLSNECYPVYIDAGKYNFAVWRNRVTHETAKVQVFHKRGKRQR